MQWSLPQYMAWAALHERWENEVAGKNMDFGLILLLTWIGAISICFAWRLW